MWSVGKIIEHKDGTVDRRVDHGDGTFHWVRSMSGDCRLNGDDPSYRKYCIRECYKAFRMVYEFRYY